MTRAVDRAYETLKRAADLGFMPDDAALSMAMLDACASPTEAFALAMDLARYLNVSLHDATQAIVVPKRLPLRYGFGAAGVDPLVDALSKVDGQSLAYSHTLHGRRAAYWARHALRLKDSDRVVAR